MSLEVMGTMSLGTRLRALRTERRLSQGELGRLLGLDNTTISSYERGISNPNGDILKAIADYFDVTTDYLLGRTDDQKGIVHGIVVGPFSNQDGATDEPTLRRIIGHASQDDEQVMLDQNNDPHIPPGVDRDEYLAALNASSAIHDCLAERISTLRQARGMSRADLAAALLVRERAVELWEHAVALPKPAQLDALARLFGVTVDWLLGRAPAPDQTKPLDLPAGWQEVLIEAVGRGLDPTDVKRAIEFLSDLQAKQKREG